MPHTCARACALINTPVPEERVVPTDANPEFIADIRRVLDDADVSWQTSELGKVDQGGGGAIAYIMANYGMEVIDSGVAVQNMRAPWEVSQQGRYLRSIQRLQGISGKNLRL